MIACSALKKLYRDELRADPMRTYFVFIQGDRELLKRRIEGRKGHFMKVGMLDGQLATLQEPTGEEGVVEVSADDSTDKQAEVAANWLREHLEGLEERLGIGK